MYSNHALQHVHIVTPFPQPCTIYIFPSCRSKRSATTHIAYLSISMSLWQCVGSRFSTIPHNPSITVYASIALASNNIGIIVSKSNFLTTCFNLSMDSTMNRRHPSPYRRLPQRLFQRVSNYATSNKLGPAVSKNKQHGSGHKSKLRPRSAPITHNIQENKKQLVVSLL